uniref:Uncharacterized protein n=1 Tax=Anguilla anguilla TaxID=7936 RepID=A0A0E9QNI3_ANGAN
MVLPSTSFPTKGPQSTALSSIPHYAFLNNLLW